MGRWVHVAWRPEEVGMGHENARREIEAWRAMTVVLDSGELRPTHLRATKLDD